MGARVGEHKLAYFRQHVLPIAALSDPCIYSDILVDSHLVHPVNPVKCIKLSSIRVLDVLRRLN